jgi:hypothetical protein
MSAAPTSAGARKPNASALVGIAAAESGIAAVSTTAILRSFRFMTRPSVVCFSGEPALELSFANVDVKQGTSWDLRPAVSQYLATW